MMHLLHLDSEEDLIPDGELDSLSDFKPSSKQWTEDFASEGAWNEVFFDALEEQEAIPEGFTNLEHSFRSIQRSMNKLSTSTANENDSFASKDIQEGERRKSFAATDGVVLEEFSEDEIERQFCPADFSALPEVRVRLRRQRSVSGVRGCWGVTKTDEVGSPKQLPVPDIIQTVNPHVSKITELKESGEIPILRSNASKLKEKRKGTLQPWKPSASCVFPFSSPSSSIVQSSNSSSCETPASSDSYHSCHSRNSDEVLVNPCPNLTWKPPIHSGCCPEENTTTSHPHASSPLSCEGLENTEISLRNPNKHLSVTSTSTNNIYAIGDKANLRKRRSLIKSCIYPETSYDDSRSYIPSPSPKSHNSMEKVCPSLRPFSSNISLNTPSNFKLRLRRATTTLKKELRKTFRTWSMVLSPSSSNSSNLFEKSFDPMEGWPSEDSSTQADFFDPTSESISTPLKPQSVVFPWKKDEAPGEDDIRESRIPRGTQAGHSPREVRQEDDVNRVPLPSRPVDEEDDRGEEVVLHCQGPRPHLPPASARRVSLSRSEWDIHRPWSQHDDVTSHAISQSSCRLSMEDQQQYLERRSDQRVEAVSMPYVAASDPLGQVTAEGKFQKFKKSLSLRLAKKGARAESPNRGGEKAPTGWTPPAGEERHAPQLEDMGICHNVCCPRDEEVKPSYFKFGHPLFRSSKERKKAKTGDSSRASKCNSGDSGDSGIELASGTSTLVGDLGLPVRIDTVPLFNELNDNGEPGEIGASDTSDVHAKVLRRTRSDMSKSRPLQRHLLGGDPHYRQSLGRQYSSPQPIKVRPFHRLPDYSIEASGSRNSRIKRSKGSAHLRRSVSQPLDLDKSFQAQVSLLKMRIPDEDASVKNQRRRPSVGNLLSEEDNSSEEDAGLSDSEEFRQGFKRGLEEDEEVIVFAEALWDHVSLDSDELVFKAGDLVTVLDSSDKDWWWGRISHRSGWFPASFVRLLVNQEDHQDKDEAQCELEEGEWSSRKLSLSSLSHDQVRANVINEILSTEKDYVKHLKDVVEGYLKQVRKRPDMFSEETITTIFGNMEALYNFHAHFLEQLEHCIDYENPHRSCIGECFIRNKSRFEIYSEYCNNHPSAVSELQVLYQDQKYVHFFEACRLLQEMIDISIDGFLLTPVQKICKYPLQLQELLKYTRPNHPDYSTVHGAMQAMKEVALLVNERRRRMECLEKIALWQKGVEGWEGPDLLDDSSQLIYQGEVTKGVGGSWPKEVTLFLFDHQMVYCKRDLLKRNTYVYRGRINTDLCEVIDIPDDPMRSAAFHHAWKIHYLHKSKTYVFTCKTASEKAKWLLAFKRERALVAMDEASGFVASEKQKQVARMAARNQRTRPKKPRVKAHARKQVMTYAQAQLLVNTEKADESRSNSLPSRSQNIAGEGQKKKGHWFSFGGHKKSRNNSRNQKHNSFHNS